MGIRGGSKLKAMKWVGYWNYKGSVGSKLGRKGYVPVRVGRDEESSRRFMVQTKALKDERFCELLSKSAEELGFRNDGVLRILYEPHDFERCILNSNYSPNKISNLRSILSRPLPNYHHLFHRFRLLKFKFS